ncbi:hypothetical protein CEB3_c20120 [Peptococcaceae bacterium CEB3]|nr:hypothetical protein CEB3_c20120 [Peptococcaceae bacterium CEB3]
MSCEMTEAREGLSRAERLKTKEAAEHGDYYS